MHKPLFDCLQMVHRLFDLSAGTLLALVEGEFHMHFGDIIEQGGGNEEHAELADETSGGEREGELAAASAPSKVEVHGEAADATELANNRTDLIDEVLEQWETAVQSEWDKLKSVVEVAIKVQAIVGEAVSKASLQAVDVGSFSAMFARLDSMGVCINHLRIYLGSVGCLLSGATYSADYASLSSAWSEWESLSPDEQAERGAPTLELLLQGAQAVRDLKMWVRADPHAKDPSSLSMLAKTLLDADLSYRFASLVKSNVAKAMQEVRRMSMIDKFALLNTATIHRCASEGRLNACADMMVLRNNPSGSTTASPGDSVLMKSISSFLDKAAHDTTAPGTHPSSVWPHTAATQMAKQCLQTLSNKSNGDDEVAEGQYPSHV